MHSLVIFSTVAESEREAHDKVSAFINENCHWSDWNEIGGRWDGFIEGKNVFSYKENPEAFLDAVKKAIEYRTESINRLIVDVGSKTLAEIVGNPKYYEPTSPDSDMDRTIDELLTAYRAKVLLGIVTHESGPEQTFFDTEDHRGDDRTLRKRIESDPDKQWLVVWDFHH